MKGKNTKRKRYLRGGPFANQTIYLQGDASSTVTFGVGDFYGRYEGDGWSSILRWVQYVPQN